MPFSSDFEKIPTMFGLYFLPSLIVGIGVFACCFVYAGFYSSSQWIERVQINKQTVPFEHMLASIALPKAKSKFYQVRVDVLNVRTAPTTNSLIKTKVYQFNQVEILEVDGDWARVKEGWVKKEFLRKV